jgi:hypothetical protein
MVVRDGTQGLVHARQALYLLAISTVLNYHFLSACCMLRATNAFAHLLLATTLGSILQTRKLRPETGVLGPKNPDVSLHLPSCTETAWAHWVPGVRSRISSGHGQLHLLQ